MKTSHIIAVVVLAGALAAMTALVLPKASQVSETDVFTAPGLDPLTIGDAPTEFWRLTPALLLVV